MFVINHLKTILNRITNPKKTTNIRHVYRKLTPTDDVGLEGYEEALNFAFSSHETRNIAISGSFGSGKSSVLKSYEKKKTNLRFLHISFAHFNFVEKSTSETNKSDSSSDQSDFGKDRVSLEGKIINHLIHQLSPRQTKYSNFKVRRDSSRLKILVKSGFVVIVILALLHIINRGKWCEFVEESDFKWGNIFFHYTTTNSAILFSMIMVVVGMLVFSFLLFRTCFSRHIFRKISVYGNEIELFSGRDDSCFDKYLDDVLYLFMKSNVDAIVFDDLDRFDDMSVFTRLREINGLVNTRLERKHPLISRIPFHKKLVFKHYPIRFIYLLRDDVFSDYKDRTKFFDFILPVVPYIDSSNSYNILRKYLEESGDYKNINDSFLKEVSLYIDDPRIMKNIYNEFIVYKDRLDIIDLHLEKLFALITYKNIFPSDFADLQLKRGYVFYLLTNVKNYCLRDLKDELKLTEKQIEECQEEHLLSTEELAILDQKYSSMPRNGTASVKQYEKWKKEDYPKHKRVLDAIESGKLSILEKEKQEKEMMIHRIEERGASFCLSTVTNTSAFNCPYENDERLKDGFERIINNHYFLLLRLLLERGYIDETYEDYLTHFYPNSLSLSDKKYIRAVKDHVEIDPGYTIDNPELVVTYLTEYDYKQPQIINYQLLDYIFISGSECEQIILNQIKEKQDLKTIASCVDHSNSPIPFITKLASVWPLFFEELYKHMACSENTLMRISYVIVKYCSENIVAQVDINNKLSEYISSCSSFISMDLSSENLRRSLKQINVVFEKIDKKFAKGDDFRFIYENDLYMINEANIELFLKSECAIADVEAVYKQLFSFVVAHDDYPLCKYLWTNVNDTAQSYLDFYKEKIDDNSDVVVLVINTLEVQIALRYIERLNSKIERISSISNHEVYPILLEKGAVEFSIENIELYLREYGFDSYMEAFINSSEKELDYSKMNEEDRNDFFKDVFASQHVDDDKYIRILKQIFGGPFEVNSLQEISKQRIQLLMDNNCLIMSDNTIVVLRESHPDLVADYMVRNVEEFTNRTSIEISPEEMAIIMERSDIDDNIKVVLLHRYTQPISCQSASLSDKVKAYILEHNFCDTDFPWVVKNYESFSESLKETINTVIQKNAEKGYECVDDMNISIQTVILSSVIIDEKTKMTYLEFFLPSTKKDTLCILLKALKADEIADNINDGNKRIHATKRNGEILQILRNAGRIKEPNLTPKRNYYSRIKYTEHGPKPLIRS